MTTAANPLVTKIIAHVAERQLGIADGSARNQIRAENAELVAAAERQQRCPADFAPLIHVACTCAGSSPIVTCAQSCECSRHELCGCVAA